MRQRYWRKYDEANAVLRSKLPFATSINSFLSEQKDHPLYAEMATCAKLAMAYLILSAEQESWLANYIIGSPALHDNITLGHREHSWYFKLFRLLAGGKSKEQLEGLFDNVTLVIFNYDRCVEHFLHAALMQKYDMSPEEAADLINRHLTIVHPYGVVGKLPWQKDANGENTITFGGMASSREGILRDSKKMLAASEQIKTFGEADDGHDGDIAKIKRGVDVSHVMVYLGFSFLNQQNMKFTMHKMGPMNARVLATAHGVSDAGIERIKILLHRHQSGPNAPEYNRHIADLTCARFLDDFAHALILDK